MQSCFLQSLEKHWKLRQFKVTEVVAREKAFLEISYNSQENTLAQVFSCEFCENSNNTFYYRTPLVAASKVKAKRPLSHISKLASDRFCYRSAWKLFS